MDFRYNFYARRCLILFFLFLGFCGPRIETKTSIRVLRVESPQIYLFSRYSGLTNQFFSPRANQDSLMRIGFDVPTEFYDGNLFVDESSFFKGQDETTINPDEITLYQPSSERLASLQRKALETGDSLQTLPIGYSVPIPQLKGAENENSFQFEIDVKARICNPSRCIPISSRLLLETYKVKIGYTVASKIYNIMLSV